MRKRMLALLLSVVMAVGLLPAAAWALDETAHDHTGWTAVTMGDTYINLGGTEQESNTLMDGSYYLDADLNVSLTIEGTVDLCLNGCSVTVGSGHAVTVGSGASLTICNCGAEGAGKLAYTGTDTSYYGIYNQGTLTLHSGAVEGYYCGVTNYSTSTFTMTGGTVTATGTSGRGVYNSSSTSVFNLSGGSVSGGQYGIYNHSSDSQVYLSGSPTVTGTTAGIYTNSYSSKLYADDGAAGNAVPYSGDAISLRYSSCSNGNTVVYHVTEATKDKFTLTGSSSIIDNYELKFSAEDNALQFQGKPQALTWYGIDGEDGEELTGDGYPVSHPYGAYFDSSDLPAAPAVEGKLFLGWLYKRGNDSDWSTQYWSGSSIYNATAFKADYIDGFTGGGSGTEDDPYQLTGAADLQTLATLIGKGIAAYNNRDIYYQLTENIDLSAVCYEGNNWTPIGRGERNSYTFKANLDGSGRTISNLYIDTDRSYQGLFYRLDGATVKNLTLTGSVTAGGDYGALAGHIQNSTVEHVDVTGVTLTSYGYTTGENHAMAYKVDDDNTIHVQGNYKNNWIQTTYARAGYSVATTANLKDAVTASADLINGGRYVQLSYTVTAGETAITDGKLAVHADVQIGDNDDAAVEAIQDADGQVIGLKMVDTHTNCLSRDAQFNLYFDGTGGVTPVDTYWFGHYSERDDINSTYGRIYFAPLNDDTKSRDCTYEQDASGVYTRLSGTDSGFAVSWQSISLEPGQSKTYSFILGVGEKADPPKWDDGKAVSLTLAADVEQNNRLVNVSARVKDAAGLTDTLYYSVDGGEGEVLGEVAADGATMKAITGQLDLSGWPEGSYLFSFWVVNSKGAASASVERTLTITADGIRGLDGDEPAHEHNWGTAWSKNSTHHWHECAANGCDVTSNSGKDGYAEHTKAWVNTDAAQHWQTCAVCGWTGEKTAHVYDNDADTTCNTCGYVRTVTPAYSISGTVENHESAPVEGAAVRLMKGREQIGESVTTDEQGKYSFTGVAPGSYNVVATKDGKTMTILVTVTAADLTGQDLSMPGENVNSVLDVKDTTVPNSAADITKVTVGGLEAVAEAVKNAPENSSAASVTVTMTVEARDETTATDNEKAEIGQIKTVATGKTLEYVAIKVEKTIGNGDPEAVTDTGDTVIEIVVPYDFSGKRDVTVYRYHNGNAKALTRAGSKAGGTFRLSTDSVTIYATKFSTYAIGYTTSGGGGSGGGGGSSPATYPIRVPDGIPNGAVSVSHKSAGKGTTVTITAAPDTGYVIGKVTVTGKDGREIAVTAKGDGKYVFTMPGEEAAVNAVFVKASGGYKNCPKDDACPLRPYTDVSTEAWYHDGVHYCMENGLMGGYGGSLFGPNDNLSRGQLAQILFNREGRPAVHSLIPYSDVEPGLWCAEAIRWAAGEGVVTGYGDGRFGPGDHITRQQLAVMLWRCAGSPAAADKELRFTDADKVSGYALEALRWAVENGVINGCGDGRLDPQGPATRAQAAQMLMNFLEK